LKKIDVQHFRSPTLEDHSLTRSPRPKRSFPKYPL
jgi:hypothetical protein